MPDPVTSLRAPSPAADPGAFRAAKSDRGAELMQAAQAFEGLFLQELAKAGRSAKLGEDILGSSAIDTHQSMLDMELTRSASQRTRFGIAQAIYDQFAAAVPGAGRSR
ncbi:flagellar biosynthesis protein FlgJ [Meridianimarinicoccus roseus]|jgi:flagellar protein FlgJ|uniref:Flagellar biosynthesis protein FlgJ n=1 Tax=Meridianimarinicoccus roseus TaxID=2072018 RepID=A0A2V2LH40_9RHOB|nr:rod-binding protein [Meridianimarinicoccus roseus]PWR02566.1 flagellar biosynthesis protein FlgJ [Meridianimarinicoccus roseus]